MRRTNSISTSTFDLDGVKVKWSDRQSLPVRNNSDKNEVFPGKRKRAFRYVVPIVAITYVVSLLLFPPKEMELEQRKLSIEIRKMEEFIPRLSFTNKGYYPNSEATRVRFHIPADDDPTKKKDNSVMIQPQSGQEFAITISNLPEELNRKNENTDCPLGIYVWIESIDTKAVFSVPVFFLDATDDNETENVLILRTAITDPGRYHIHILGYGTTVLEEGARGTVGNVRPLPASPWLIEVLPTEEQIAKSLYLPDKTYIQLPTRICDSSDLELSGKGRWVECAAAGIPQEQCLYDGWVYLPTNCQWDLLPHVDALNLSKEIAQDRNDKPVWIVVTGSSIERGGLHALVDMLGGIGRYDSDVNGVKESIADVLFKGVQNVRGQGSSVKCWGWYDVQIGSIRLSYLDWRMSKNKDDNFRETSLNTLKEILQQGPDTVVMGDINDKGYLFTPFHEIIQIAADIPTFDGDLIFAPQKPRFFGKGGIGKCHVCRKDLPILNKYMVDNDRATETEPPTMGDFLRASVNNALEQCGDHCSNLVDRTIIWEETKMAWSFLMDAEYPMSSPIMSQHFHTYTDEPFPRRACGSSHSERRYVVGSVTEMTAAIMLTTTLDRLHAKMGKKLSDRQHRSTCDLFENEEQELQFAMTHRFKSCFSCPKKACCDFPNTRWLPAMIPGQSLSDPILKNTVTNFNDGDMEFCYDGTQ